MLVKLAVYLQQGRGDVGSLASTSPPRQRMVLPTPVRTTEQYCASLLTVSFTRFSM